MEQHLVGLVVVLAQVSVPSGQLPTVALVVVGLLVSQLGRCRQRGVTLDLVTFHLACPSA